MIFVAISIYKETNKKRQIQSEIGKLREEADRIDRENSIIQEKIAYFESRDYMEKEAKDKLNLQNPDEQVVVVKPSMAKEIPAGNKPSIYDDRKALEPANYLKWRDYFFKY